MKDMFHQGVMDRVADPDPVIKVGTDPDSFFGGVRSGYSFFGGQIRIQFFGVRPGFSCLGLDLGLVFWS